MERETSISKEQMVREINALAETLEKRHGVRLWLVEVLGRRWSYVAGQQDKGVSLLPPHRIRLNDRFGIVSHGWADLPCEEKKRLLGLLREAVGLHGQG